ncbi:MAG: hypothetical protein EP330_14025 [Deltaproteobacteria bacterium]|nr:MAG: hypothetical protein EP330_14025 [Deltaproteobacteria bacterium]
MGAKAHRPGRAGQRISPPVGDALGVPAVLAIVFGAPAGAMVASWTAPVGAEVALTPRGDGALLTLRARF